MKGLFILNGCAKWKKHKLPILKTACQKCLFYIFKGRTLLQKKDYTLLESCKVFGFYLSVQLVVDNKALTIWVKYFIIYLTLAQCSPGGVGLYPTRNYCMYLLFCVQSLLWQRVDFKRKGSILFPFRVDFRHWMQKHWGQGCLPWKCIHSL